MSEQAKALLSDRLRPGVECAPWVIDAVRELEAALSAPAQGEAGTPASRWSVEGQPDPHGTRYDCERAALAMGDLTDDELANGVFLYGADSINVGRLRDPAYIPGTAYLSAAKDRIRWLSRKLAEATTPPAPSAADATFQQRVAPWMQECFGAAIASDVRERGDRLLEEVLELLQSHDYDPARVATLRDYVWGRPKGEPAQEVGGVMVTLAAYCLATDIDMHDAGEVELARILRPEVVEKIRAKQASKRGLHTPLPVSPTEDKGGAWPDDAAIRRVVMRYIDRMMDVCPPADPAERILKEFVADVWPIIDTALAAAAPPALTQTAPSSGGES